jgi:hypothetical protein
VTVGKEKLTLFVDTGSSVTLLTTAAAKRLKLKTEKSEQPRELFATPRKVEEAVLKNVGLGNWEIPRYGVMVADLDGLATKAELDVVDGVLGSDLLTFFSAVLDTEKPAMYIIPPAARLWPKLRGEWVGSEVQTDGRVVKDDGPEEARLSFGEKEGELTIRLARKWDVTTTLHIIKSGQRFLFQVQADAMQKHPPLFSTGMLEVVDDTLRICYPLEPKGDASDFQRLPKAFEGKKGSGHVLFTFTRVKADPPKK